MDSTNSNTNTNANANTSIVTYVTPFMIRAMMRMRQIRKFLYTHVWIPMSKAYNTIHDYLNKVWTEWNRCDTTNDAMSNQRAKIELSTSATSTSMSSSAPSSPKSPTSIHIDTGGHNRHEDMEIHNRSMERPTTNNVTPVDITATIERELSEVSVMKISHSNSISSLIRENYVDSSGNADGVSL